MEKISTNNTYLITGGAFNVTGTVLSAISKVIGTLYDLGVSLGSSIRRSQINKPCLTK